MIITTLTVSTIPAMMFFVVVIAINVNCFFFLTTFPVAIFCFVMSILAIQTSFSFSLLLAAIFGSITTLNFYLHSLTSN